jgi:hypothetical protein
VSDKVLGYFTFLEIQTLLAIDEVSNDPN